VLQQQPQGLLEEGNEDLWLWLSLLLEHAGVAHLVAAEPTAMRDQHAHHVTSSIRWLVCGTLRSRMRLIR